MTDRISPETASAVERLDAIADCLIVDGTPVDAYGRFELTYGDLRTLRAALRSSGHAQSSQEPGDPEIKELRRLADDLVAEGWHDDAVFVQAAANTIERHAQTPAGCGDPNCKDPDCTYGKGRQRCQNCGDPISEIYCGTCREMGCADTSTVPTHCDNCGLEFKPNDDVFASVNHSVRRTVHLKCPSDTSTDHSSKPLPEIKHWDLPVDLYPPDSSPLRQTGEA